MISRFFKCDLCRDPFDSLSEGVAFGLIWKTDGLYIVKELRGDVEHHICIKCFQAIRGYNP